MSHNDTTELFPVEGAADDTAAAPAPGPRLARPRRRSTADELLAALERVERTLVELRRSVDTGVRERRHREFSAARLIGSILQALVLGLVLWALSDWLFAEPREGLLVKLAFAGVLQLGALTGFLLGREVD